MTKQPKHQPVVLVINGMTRSIESIGNDNSFTEHIFGIRPRFVELHIKGWMLSPEVEMWDLAEAVPDKSPEELKQWIHSDDYGAWAMRKIQKKIDKASREEAIDPETVRVIMCCPATVTETVLAAISRAFPNAFICSRRGEQIARPLAAMSA